MLMIGNGRLVTRDAEQPFFENGAVVIDGTTVKKVGAVSYTHLTLPTSDLDVYKRQPMSISTAPWQEALALTDMIQKDF